MVTVARSAFVEQPNGDLTCTITIPAAQRLAVLGGEAVVLAPTPGPTDTAEKLAAGAMSAMAFHADSAPFVVELEPADTAAEKPEPRTVGAQGIDAPAIMASMAAHPWNHPAAPFLQSLYRHPPFQKFALQRTSDPFAAPMATVNALLASTVQGRDMPGAVSALEQLMSQYTEWASSQGLPLWPAR